MGDEIQHKPLTPKEEMFCQEYIVDLNQCKAYQRAFDCQNYDTSRTSSSKLFAKANISARIKELMDIRLETIGLSQQWVLSRLVEISDRCMQEKPVQEWDYDAKCFKDTGEYEFDSNGANKATELLGKHFAMFTDKIKNESPVQATPPIVNIYNTAPPMAASEQEIED